MKIVLVSKCSLYIEQYVEFKISVLISPSKPLISSRWVTNVPISVRYFPNASCQLLTLCTYHNR